MEHYSLKEENQPECSNPFPVELSENAKLMTIKENTKFRNIVSYVEKQMENTGETLYQWNVLQTAITSDVYKPDDEQMSTLKVEISVPAMHIMLSRDPFPEQYQCSSMQSTDEEYPSFLKKQKRESHPRKPRNQDRPKKPRDEVKSNPWRRPEKAKPTKGSKKMKTNLIGENNVDKPSVLQT